MRLSDYFPPLDMSHFKKAIEEEKKELERQKKAIEMEIEISCNNDSINSRDILLNGKLIAVCGEIEIPDDDE